MRKASIKTANQKQYAKIRLLYICENAILLQTREINKNLRDYKGSGSENKFRAAICIKIKNSLLSTAAFCAKLSFIVHHQINQQPII